MALLNFSFNADGLIQKLQALQRDYQHAPEALMAAHETLALATAEKAVAILKSKEVGRRPVTNVLEEVYVDPENRRVTYVGFELGIAEFLDARTGDRGTPYWRMIEETGVTGFTRVAAFTENVDRSGPYTAPGGAEGQRFMPTVKTWEAHGGQPNFGALPSEWRRVVVASRPAYHPLADAAQDLMSNRAAIFEIYREAFARIGISLASTRLGNRGVYLNA